MRTRNFSLALALAAVGCGAPNEKSDSTSSSLESSTSVTSAVTSPAGAQACQPLVTPPQLHSWAKSAKFADLNGDGLSDLIVGNTNDNVLSVALGVAGGGFGAVQSVPFGAADEAEEFDVADLNGDHIPDIVVAKGYDFGSVQLLFGKGDGTFTLGAELSAHPGGFAGPNGARIADFNGDGIKDFVTQNVNENTLSVFIGDGKGGFGTPILSTFSHQWFGVLEAVDLNRDGVLDIVSHDGYAIGRGDGSFKAQQSWPGRLSTFGTVTTADFNGDGIIDVAGVYLSDEDPKLRSSVVVLLGKGDGTFGTASTLAHVDLMSSAQHNIAAADVDHDGRLDVTVGSGNNAHVFFGAGNGTFPRRQDLGVGGTTIVAATSEATPRVFVLNGFASSSGGILRAVRCGS